MRNRSVGLVRFFQHALAVAALTCISASAHASELLASWQSSDNGASSLPESFTAPYVAASTVNRGAGITAATSGGLFGATGFGTAVASTFGPPSFVDIGAAGGPVAAGDFFQWSVTNTSANNIYVDRIRLALGQFNAPSGATTFDGVLDTNFLQGIFLNAIDNLTEEIPFTPQVLGPGQTLDMRLSLTNFEEAGDPYTGSVEFKNEWDGQAIQVFGGQVPEPSSFAAIVSLLGCGAGFGLRRRRRNR